MGILELPGVHMHWADRWGLRKRPGFYSTITVLETPVLAGIVRSTDYGETWAVEPPGALTMTLEPEPEPQPWFTVRCGVCDQEIEFYLTVGLADFNPFNATVMVVQCGQCATRWAAILPPVTVTEADKLNLQEAEVIDGNTN